MLVLVALLYFRDVNYEQELCHSCFEIDPEPIKLSQRRENSFVKYGTKRTECDGNLLKLLDRYAVRQWTQMISIYTFEYLILFDARLDPPLVYNHSTETVPFAVGYFLPNVRVKAVIEYDKVCFLAAVHNSPPVFNQAFSDRFNLFAAALLLRVVK